MLQFLIIITFLSQNLQQLFYALHVLKCLNFKEKRPNSEDKEGLRTYSKGTISLEYARYYKTYLPLVLNHVL